MSISRGALGVLFLVLAFILVFPTFIATALAFTFKWKMIATVLWVLMLAAAWRGITYFGDPPAPR